MLSNMIIQIVADTLDCCFLYDEKRRMRQHDCDLLGCWHLALFLLITVTRWTLFVNATCTGFGCHT